MRHVFRTAIITAALLLAVFATVGAEVRLPGFFTDHMVLQRDMPVPIRGWANPGEKVTVAFAGQTQEAAAGADGTWMVKLEPMKADAKGQVLSIAGTNINDVLVGEVWICSGQSNMEWTLGRSLNAGQEVAAAKYPAIRHLKIGHINKPFPQDDVKAAWQVCSPRTAGSFTAVGYFFGRKLHTELDVPVGLIGSNWGGTRVEPWTPPVGFRAVPALKSISEKVDAGLPTTETGRKAWSAYLAGLAQWLPRAKAAVGDGKYPPAMPRRPTSLGPSHQEPAKLYNGMIAPLVPYAVRGAIWYQGESNGGEGISYFYKKKALITGWRTVWNQGPFPFYFVQLANFRQRNDDPAGGDGWAKLREAQRKCLEIENTGMAVTIDIGNPRDIHPKNKQDVGARLARWALAKDYGRKDLVCSGPLYEKMTVENGAARISFTHTGGGLIVGEKEGLAPVRKVENGELKGFSIAGQDRKWHWAKAGIGPDEKTVIVSCDAVTKPAAVRYGFRTNPGECNLYNAAGLPASPFRTDDW